LKLDFSKIPNNKGENGVEISTLTQMKEKEKEHMLSQEHIKELQMRK
jgi:hypothetical protein